MRWPVTFSYSQISQYLRCPRSYRFRYLDGWKEKESKASLCFGRCFEKALAAFFKGEDPGAVLFKEWGTYRDVPLEYPTEMTGSGCFAKALRCSNSWFVITAFAFPTETKPAEEDCSSAPERS